MPALKSIFSKDLSEGADKFKDFQKNFTKYREQLDKMPQAWQAVEKESKGVSDGFKAMTATLLAQQAVMDKQVASVKAINSGFRETFTISKGIHETWRKMADSDIWRSTSSQIGWVWRAPTELLSKALSVFNPLHVGLGLAGAGGTLLGLDLLGGAASRGLRTSVGQGTTYGEGNAFGLTYNRLADASSILNSVAAAKGNIGGPESNALLTLGVNSQGDTAQVGKRTLDRLRELAKGTPEALWQSMIVEGFGAGNLGVGTQDLRRLRGMGDQEYGRYSNQFGTRSQQLGVDEGTLRKWQDFVNTLDVTGKRIESTLIRGLVGATGPLEKLSDAAASLVEKFVKSQGFVWAIDKVTQGMSWLAQYASDGRMQRDLESLFTGLASFAEWLQRWFGSSSPQSQTNTYKPVTPFEEYRKQFFSDVIHKGKEGDPSAERVVRENYGAYLMQQGQGGTGIWTGASAGTPGTMASVTTNGSLLDTIRALEGSPNINGKAQISPAGAIGPFQIMPGTAAGYGVSRDQLFDDNTNKATAEKIVADLSRRYKGNTAAILAAYNAGPMIGDYIEAHPGHLPRLRPNDNQPWDYQQTRGYLDRAGIKVVIDNPAGSDVATQVNQMGGSFPAVPGVVPR